MRALRALGVGPLVLVVLTACGGGDPPAAKTPPPVASASPDAGAPVAANVRTPSAAVARYWPFRQPTTGSAFIDVAGLMKTTLFGQGGVTIATELFTAQGMADVAKCLHDGAPQIRELVGGAIEERWLFEIGAGSGGGPTVAASCIDASPSYAKAPPIAGTDQTWNGTDSDGSPVVAVRVGDTLLMGTPQVVTDALSSSPTPRTLPASLRLQDDQYAVLDDELQGNQVHFTMAASDQHLALEADVTFADPKVEDIVADKVNELTGPDVTASFAQQPKEIADTLTRLIKATSIKREGKTLRARFDLVESPVGQAHDVATAATVATYAVRRYILNSELAEPRSILPVIAKTYVEAYEEGLKKKPPQKKLQSFPPVPAKVPTNGKAIVTPSAGWAAWKPLGNFEISDPLYFQYEIVADKKGTGADVLAHGDLDGDGKLSTFRIHVTIDPKTHHATVGDGIDETDVEE